MTSVKRRNVINIEHILKENAAIALQILFTVFLNKKNNHCISALFKHEEGETKSRTTNTRGVWIDEESNS